MANDDIFSTPEDTEVTQNLVSNDTDPGFGIDPTTVDLDISSPLIVDGSITTAEGSYSVDASGVLTFVPAADFFGSASLQYTVQNTDVTPVISNAANIQITITAVNDAPVISALAHVNIAMNTTGPVNPFEVSDVDTDPGTITVIAETNNATLLPLTGIDLVHVGGGDWTVAVTPATGERGAATVKLKINDGLSPDVVGTFTVTVDNTDPTISSLGGPYTINEDTSTPTIDFTINDAETPGTLTIDKSTTDPSVIPVGNIVLTGTGTDRHVVVTPLPNQFTPVLTPVTITLTVHDGDGGLAVQTFTVQV
ncbi:MAG: Ig-like domain-containing protein, partial [Chryseolinea sp.]